MNTYLLGETIRLFAEFSDEAGAPVDVTGVTMRVKLPDATFATLSDVVRDSAGRFHRDYLPAVAGFFVVQATCTGPSTSVAEETFRVNAGSFPAE